MTKRRALWPGGHVSCFSSVHWSLGWVCTVWSLGEPSDFISRPVHPAWSILGYFLRSVAIDTCSFGG